MPKQKLTKTFILKVPIPKSKSKVLYTDTSYKNLVLEVRNNGAKTFYYRNYLNGKTNYKKLGNYPTNTLEEIVEFYLDKETLENQPQLPKNSITLKMFFYDYYFPYIKVSKKSYSQDKSFYENHILPILGNKYLEDITKADISILHINLVKEKKHTNSTANKLLKFLSYSYNLAIMWEMPNVIKNPVKYVKPFKENEHLERFLNKDEIKLILNEASKCSNELVKPLLEFLLLTGARKSEALNTKWSDIDLINNIYTIPNTKSGKIRRIPISNKLKTVINSIPRYDSDYLFPSPNPNKPMKNFIHHWYKIRKKVNLEDVRIHDLRHTFASTLVNNGVSLYTVQKLLGHSDISITQRYSHLSNESLQSAVDVIGEFVKS